MFKIACNQHLPSSGTFLLLQYNKWFSKKYYLSFFVTSLTETEEILNFLRFSKKSKRKTTFLWLKTEKSFLK